MPAADRVRTPYPTASNWAIDRIAMQEGLVGSDAYLDQWHWSAKQERAGTPEDVLQALLRETEEEGERILAAYKRS